MYFGIWDLELNVGPDPRKRVEFNAHELFHHAPNKNAQRQFRRKTSGINKHKATKGPHQARFSPKWYAALVRPRDIIKKLVAVRSAKATSELHSASIAL